MYGLNYSINVVRKKNLEVERGKRELYMANQTLKKNQ